MSALKNILKEMAIRELGLLLETAIQVNQVSKMALYVEHDGNNVRCILYDPHLLEEFFEEYKKHFGRIDIRNLGSIEQSFLIPNPVFGMMRLEKNTEYKSWVVRNSAAEKGYGPLMYDIAFSFAGKNGLTPDRDGIRPAAKNIWFYIWKNKQNEFDITPLETKTGKQDDRYTHQDNEAYLDKRYVMSNPKSQTYQTLFQNNRRCMALLRSLPSEYVLEPEDLLLQLSRKFFQNKFSPSLW